MVRFEAVTVSVILSEIRVSYRRLSVRTAHTLGQVLQEPFLCWSKGPRTGYLGYMSFFEPFFLHCCLACTTLYYVYPSSIRLYIMHFK